MKTRRSAEKEEFWRLVISEQHRSGLSIKEFCKQQNISEAAWCGCTAVSTHDQLGRVHRQ